MKKQIEQINKIKDNKVLNIIGDIIYFIVFIFIVMLLVVEILQRVSNNAITLGGIRLFTVASGSMIPEYEIGDVLLAKEVDSADIKVGDDIVYYGKEDAFAGKFITHRVISIEPNDNGGYNIITQGIANTAQDPQITDEQVYGKIMCKMKLLSLIGTATQNMYVFYVLVFIPIAVLIFKQIRNIAKE